MATFNKYAPFIEISGNDINFGHPPGPRRNLAIAEAAKVSLAVDRQARRLERAYTLAFYCVAAAISGSAFVILEKIREALTVAAPFITGGSI